MGETFTGLSGPRFLVRDVARFELDYTFYLNVLFAVVAGAMVWLYARSRPADSGGHDYGGGSLGPKRIFALLAAVVLVIGNVLSFFTGPAG